MAPLVELRHVAKSYGPVEVLHDVNLALRPGTVTGLCGENGAGKSTIIRLMAGAEQPTAGEVILAGAPLPAHTGAVIDAGLSVIYQELTDIPDLSLMENVLLGNLRSRAGWKNRRANLARARSGLQQVGLGHLDPQTPIRQLSLAERQLAEIARCLVREARVLVLDEPSSSLPEQEVETLLKVVGRLREEGMAVVYVSHHLDELFTVCDRLVVLRDGRLVGDAPTTEWNEESLVNAMLAKDLEHAYPWRPREIGEPIFTADEVTGPGVRGATMNIRRGEILGLVGLAGAGRTELLKSLAGVTRRTGGQVRLDGQDLGRTIKAARHQGLVYVPEDRKREGLVLEASIADNLCLGDYGSVARLGVLRSGAREKHAAIVTRRYAVKHASVRQPVARLSGGNQQRIVIARAVEAAPKVALVDDPTRGVDVGAKSGIHQQLLALAEGGAGVVITSSDTDEVLAMSDRIYVMAGQRIVAEFDRENFDREHILHLAAGGQHNQGQDA
ncbi:sugar ABC transporter ATP-binding protein [Aeromicrobium sp. IC_218]|uniref:sugar ABC transporter ATP-binding protein n=1 Tax=Aeromicrobium sp. IC_218 TaxID=2545468 RepID=UPI0013F45E85|nr:sugar ABC transporter ATP-binding protein [Aeromicrobium sp. IC_218]